MHKYTEMYFRMRLKHPVQVSYSLNNQSHYKGVISLAYAKRLAEDQSYIRTSAHVDPVKHCSVMSLCTRVLQVPS